MPQSRRRDRAATRVSGPVRRFARAADALLDALRSAPTTPLPGTSASWDAAAAHLRRGATPRVLFAALPARLRYGVVGDAYRTKHALHVVARSHGADDWPDFRGRVLAGDGPPPERRALGPLPIAGDGPADLRVVDGGGLVVVGAGGPVPDLAVVNPGFFVAAEDDLLAAAERALPPSLAAAPAEARRRAAYALLNTWLAASASGTASMLPLPDPAAVIASFEAHAAAAGGLPAIDTADPEGERAFAAALAERLRSGDPVLNFGELAGPGDVAAVYDAARNGALALGTMTAPGASPPPRPNLASVLAAAGVSVHEVRHSAADLRDALPPVPWGNGIVTGQVGSGRSMFVRARVALPALAAHPGLVVLVVAPPGYQDGADRRFARRVVDLGGRFERVALSPAPGVADVPRDGGRARALCRAAAKAMARHRETDPARRVLVLVEELRGGGGPDLAALWEAAHATGNACVVASEGAPDDGAPDPYAGLLAAAPAAFLAATVRRPLPLAGGVPRLLRGLVTPAQPREEPDHGRFPAPPPEWAVDVAPGTVWVAARPASPASPAWHRGPFRPRGADYWHTTSSPEDVVQGLQRARRDAALEDADGPTREHLARLEAAAAAARAETARARDALRATGIPVPEVATAAVDGYERAVRQTPLPAPLVDAYFAARDAELGAVQALDAAVSRLADAVPEARVLASVAARYPDGVAAAR